MPSKRPLPLKLITAVFFLSPVYLAVTYAEHPLGSLLFGGIDIVIAVGLARYTPAARIATIALCYLACIANAVLFLLAADNVPILHIALFAQHVAIAAYLHSPNIRYLFLAEGDDPWKRGRRRTHL